MTLAHELQHAIQHDKERKTWAVNSLIRNLPEATIDEFKLEWKDIPTELDARIVAKRIARDLHGEEAINRYVDKRASEATEPHDIVDWSFIRELAPSSSIDIVSETHRLFHRLRKYRQQVEETLRGFQNNPDFADIDLDEKERYAQAKTPDEKQQLLARLLEVVRQAEEQVAQLRSEIDRIKN
jgi:hypothetical protein